MIGAVIMKMMSSTKATSTREVTLMSALSGSSPWPRSPPPPRMPAISQPPFAGHRSDDLLREPLELAREQAESVHEEVVRHHRRHRSLGALLQPPWTELREEVNALTQQPVIGRRRQAHGDVVGVLEPRGLLDFHHEPVGVRAHAAELPPLQHDEIPRRDGKQHE